MDTRRLNPVFFAAYAALVLSSVATAQTNSADTGWLLDRPGDFKVANGQTTGIIHSKTDQRYRICVTHGVVPLKVTHDGKEAMIHPGNCADFEAMNIQVTPGGRISDDSVVVGRYHALR